MCTLHCVGWEWKSEDRPSFAEISKLVNSLSDVNESM